MHLQDRFIQFIQRNNLFPADHTLLLAVSGGVDSVVLCELCYRANFAFAIAHCNFRLRDEESERDKTFVCELAKRYGVDFLLKEFDTKEYASENKLSIQEGARKLRYDWFHEIIDQSDHSKKRNSSSPFQDPRLPNPDSELRTRRPSPRWILTAHHADDNVETMLMNYFRGTGIKGLRGILPKQGKLIRTLLSFRKAELVQFATDNNLLWVEDSSNESEKYSRNYFRKNIIPFIRNIYPDVEQNLLNNLQRFGDIEMLYHQSIDAHLKKLLEYKGNEIHIAILKLKKSEPLFSIVHEIIKPYNFSTGQVQELMKLIESETGKYVQSSTHRIINNRNWLIITPVITTSSENILIEESDANIEFELGNLRFQKPTTINHELQTAKNIALLNAQEITYPLLLRKWRAGDYFYPLGMNKKKKKLARFLIDHKLSKSQKENVWVVEMNKKIIWVVGMRIDERFKVASESNSVLSITLERLQTG